MSEPLTITVSPRDDHQVDLTIVLGPERTEQALQRAFRQVSKKARIPGFRPGKAPYATVLRVYGREALLGEVIDDLGQQVYQEAIEVEGLNPYAQADLVDITLDPPTFKLVMPLRPVVTLGDYGSIRLEAPAVEVGEADVDAALEALRGSHSSLQPVQRPAELGDTVLVDIRGEVDGNQIMDNRDWELVLRGASGWLPGFDEAFVGLAAGDEKSFSLVYPEDSASRFKGQTAAFEVTVKEVKGQALPDVDDAFVKELGDYESLADYRTKKLAEIRKEREDEAQARFNDAAVEALVQAGSITYPPVAVDEVVHEMLHDVQNRLHGIGYTLEDWLRLQGKRMDAYQTELRPIAEQRLKGRLVLAELARREGITVSEDERAAELERLVGGANDEAAGQKVRELFGSEGGQALITADLTTAKTLERLRAIVTGQVAAAPAEPAAIADAAASADAAAPEVVEAAETSPDRDPATADA